jgi:Mg2+ and Co2+ transporter CorA
MVDNKINEHSNKLNHIMQGLSAITIIFLPCNLISGFMGMNVLVPFADEESIIPFLIILGITAFIASMLYGLMRCLRWI